MLIILALILLNGLFAGAEIAVLSLRKTRIAELADRGRRGARSLWLLRANPERFLATVQIGITVVSATAAAFGGASLATRLSPWIARVPGLQDSAESLALGVVIVLVSFFSLVLGELVPKSLALRNADTFALLTARPFLWLASAARPFVWLLVSSSNLVLRLFGDSTSFTEALLSRDELMQLVDEAATSGSVDAEAGKIASRALDLDEIDAEDIMVPRASIVALPVEVPAETLFDMARKGAHVRMPVHDGDINNMLGLVHLRDALAAASLGGIVDLRPLLRPLPHVVEWTRGTDLLRLLLAERSQLAMVVDEHGTVRGLVGLEDLVEELVGEIRGHGEEEHPLWRQEHDGAWLVEGRAPLHELERALHIHLPEGESFATIAGLCLFLADGIPSVGAQLDPGGGMQIEVVDASVRRVRRIRLRLPTPPIRGSEA